MIRFLPKTPIGLFAVFVLWPALACVFVAMVVFCILQTILDPIKAALGETTFEPSAAETDLASTVLISVCVSALLLGFVVTVGYLVYRVSKSNKAIAKCQRNATVILSPEFSFALTRYLRSEVAVDLSRTNFEDFSGDDFPLSSIQRLTEVRVRETTVPDSLVDELLRCRWIKKIDLSYSSLSDEAASKLAGMTGVEFVVECVSEVGAV